MKAYIEKPGTEIVLYIEAENKVEEQSLSKFHAASDDDRECLRDNPDFKFPTLEIRREL